MLRGKVNSRVGKDQEGEDVNNTCMGEASDEEAGGYLQKPMTLYGRFGAVCLLYLGLYHVGRLTILSTNAGVLRDNIFIDHVMQKPRRRQHRL